MDWRTFVEPHDSYIFQADMYCDGCTVEIKKDLKKAGKVPEDLDDEDSYDSDDYPQGPYSDQESDSPQHCGSHESCVNAIELPYGGKIGAWLGGSLTGEGTKYVAETILDDLLSDRDHGRQVGRLWRHLYRDELSDRIDLREYVGPITRGRHGVGVLEALSAWAEGQDIALNRIFYDLDNLYAVGSWRQKNQNDLAVIRVEARPDGNFEDPEITKVARSEFKGTNPKVIVAEVGEAEGWF